MAIINCPECGNSISTKAEACMKCGLPISEIFICPECNNIETKNDIGVCSKCGCPMTDNSEAKKETAGETKSYNNEPTYDQSIRIAETIVSNVLARHTFWGSGIISESGRIISDSRKVNAAKIAFGIPKEDNIFFIVSGNIMGGINESSKGFALASSGIYFFDDNKKRGSFWYGKFAQLKIGTFMTFVKLGQYEFNISDTKKVKNMLLDLQNEILDHMD